MTHDFRPAGAPCRTCRHCIPQGSNVAGRIRTELVCVRKLAAFPQAVGCRDFEREPGSDDE